jgi:beta-lactam-binding protein with PASTA domain
VAHSRKHGCNGKATVPSLYIVDFHVAVNNMKPLGFAVETQERVSFALLSK